MSIWGVGEGVVFAHDEHTCRSTTDSRGGWRNYVRKKALHDQTNPRNWRTRRVPRVTEPPYRFAFRKCR